MEVAQEVQVQFITIDTFTVNITDLIQTSIDSVNDNKLTSKPCQNLDQAGKPGGEDTP